MILKIRLAHINEESIGYKHMLRYWMLNYGVPQHRERVFIIGIRNDLEIVWKISTP